MSALCDSLERQILALCSRARVIAVPRDDAPDAPDCLADHVWKRDGFLFVPVWTGASVDTIWSAPAVNYAFRAWHDSRHLTLGAGFDLESERALCVDAVRQIDGERERALLAGEVGGQVEFFFAHGRFPVAQRAFVDAYATDRDSALADGGRF